jgi:hypothetical protein
MGNVAFRTRRFALWGGRRRRPSTNRYFDEAPIVFDFYF